MQRGRARPEFFRETIRRHIWVMNEESGNMVWRGREIIGQIIAAQPALFREYASIMITAAVGEPVFYPTLMKAVQLLMAVDPKLIACRLDRLKELGMVI